MVSIANNSLNNTLNETSLLNKKKVSTEADKELAEIEKQEKNYMKLQLTMIKNQDPLSPTDPKDMAQSMNSFMQVRQGVRMEKALHKMEKLLRNATSTSEASALKGMDVFFKGGNTFNFNGAESSELSYELPENVKNAELSIFNNNNELVYTNRNIVKNSGFNQYKWDGRRTDDKPKEAGMYYFVITAKDAKDKNLPVETYGIGPVSQVWYNQAGKLEFDVNGQKVQREDLYGYRLHDKSSSSINPVKYSDTGNRLTDDTIRNLLSIVTPQASSS